MKKKKNLKELQSMGILYNKQIYKFLNKQNMKKLILISITIAILATGVLFASEKLPKAEISPTLLTNIEALATGESGGQVVQCYCKTKLVSPNICSVQADGGYCGGDPCSNHDGNCR